MRVAVVGSGAAGLAAAWLLGRSGFEVTLYEAAARPGGHCHTIEVECGGRAQPVDCGFIVYNERNYPNLTALFAALGVQTESSDMSFSVHTPCGALEYAGTNLRTVFAQKRNLARPAFLAMLRDILRFNREAARDLAAGRLAGLTLGEYVATGCYGDWLSRWYLLPMGAAIWSSSLERMMAFPAETFARFFVNHGLLAVDGHPNWRTVSGGSRRYVERILAELPGRLRAGAPVVAVRRDEGVATVLDAAGEARLFDHVVIAAHADQALAMLERPTADEAALLGAIRYQANRVVAHRDPRLMPRRRAVWSSWNYRAPASENAAEKVTLTYWMNRLQNIDPAHPFFVTVNPREEPREERIDAEMSFDHPLFDSAALAAQRRLAELQGVRRTWFCGSYFGYGFHEDAIASGLEAAVAIGAKRPWAERGRRLLCARPAPFLGAAGSEAA
jgi:predicted NAD/FAD-binding protein